MPNLLKLLDQLEQAIPKMRETLGGDEGYMEDGEGDIPDMGGMPEPDGDEAMPDDMMAGLDDVPPMPEEEEEELPPMKKKPKL